MLFKQFRDKIIMTGYYKANPEDFPEISERGRSPYWCRNWNFTVHQEDKKIFMVDTYYGTFSIEVTNENFHKFTFIADRVELNSVARDHTYMYDPKDVYEIYADSSHTPCYFVKKGTPTSKSSIRDHYESRRLEVEKELKFLTNVVDQIDQGTW